MKNMSQAQESLQAPPPGWRLSTIVDGEATSSKKSGASMLHLTTRITDGSEFDGVEADDYLITDGSAKGAGIAKKKLRGINTPLVSQALDTDMEVPDAALVQEMVGLQLFVLYGNEQRMGRHPDRQQDPSAPYDTALTTADPQTGKPVPLMKATVQGYSRSAPPGAQAGQAPIQQVAPQQYAAPAQFVPQQHVAQAPQGFAPGFAPQQPQQYAQPVQPAPVQAQPQFPGAPQGFNPANAAYPVQQGFAPPQGFVPQQAQPVWNGGQQVAVPQTEAPAKGRGKKGAGASEA
jgi:hypothetical protein